MTNLFEKGDHRINHDWKFIEPVILSENVITIIDNLLSIPPSITARELAYLERAILERIPYNYNYVKLSERAKSAVLALTITQTLNMFFYSQGWVHFNVCHPMAGHANRKRLIDFKTQVELHGLWKIDFYNDHK